jgi:hypothetical protein
LKRLHGKARGQITADIHFLAARLSLVLANVAQLGAVDLARRNRRRHADQALLKAVSGCATVYSPKMPPTEKVRDKIDPHFRQAGATL